VRLDCTSIGTGEWTQVHDITLRIDSDALLKFRNQLKEIFPELSKDGSYHAKQNDDTHVV
jgi:hypothetical protein